MSDEETIVEVVEVTPSSTMPLLPLRDVVVSPHMVVPLFVGRMKSIKALEAAMEVGRSILLVAQRVAKKDLPKPKDLYAVGCLANILQLLKLPDGTVKVLVEGTERVRLLDIVDGEEFFQAHAEVMTAEVPETMEVEALRRTVIEKFDRYARLNKKVPSEILSSFSAIEDLGRLVDTISAHLPLKVEQKQKILEILPVVERTDALLSQIEVEIDILQVEKRIRGRVKRQMEKSQREYYLNEQVKAIQKELGDGEDGADFDEIEKNIKAASMPKEALQKVMAELKKLRLMSPMSAEATVVRNYIDTLVSLPWKKKTRLCQDLREAEKVLDEDHYGLEKVKERILEYLAVQKRTDTLKAPILCLVGAPGVGKTSLAHSIARATGRKFLRMALGGVRDEAEIRGHRRTYIGSMPGKILSNMIRAGVRNPLFLLDEIDKMGVDYRGDPASALLELFDPEQNTAFVDHYVEVPYDVSDVMFVTTANTLNLPPALLDRMEIIRLSGYTEKEKLSIAKKYLIPKQVKMNGLRKKELTITEPALLDVLRFYTREAGVRSLEREISKICRKVVRAQLTQKAEKNSVVLSKNLEKYLGVRKYTYGMADKKNRIGEVTGLAWTEVGGELLTIECLTMPGKGNILRTGSIGEVMKESVEAARSVVRARLDLFKLAKDALEKTDIHVHFPEGATPKDGPSAGIAIMTALVSSLMKIPVDCSVAMTGEITLRGEVLRIGGLKEKLLAAHRGAIKVVLIPEENVRDLVEVPQEVKEGLTIMPVRWMNQVLDIALERFQETLSLREPPEPSALAVEATSPAAIDSAKSVDFFKH